MISLSRKTLCLLCAGIAALTLTGCFPKAPAETLPVSTEIITLPTAPIEEETVPPTDPNALVEAVTQVLQAGEVYTLEHYPNLKSADLTGSTCYDAIANYMAKHPEVDVTFAVDFGGTSVSNKDTAATLQPGAFSYDSLMENLVYLPSLTAITLPDVELTQDQISALVAAYPGITLNYSVELLGNSYESSITELDLTAMDGSHVEEAAGKLGLLTNLTSVTLSNSLSISQVATLQDACPNAAFGYSFSLFGKTVSTLDTEIIYKNQDIGNEGEEEIREALEILDACQRFVLDNCKLDNDVLAKIREDFRDQTKVVWRVYFGKDNRYNYLTDAETVRTVYNVTDSTCGPMQYLEDVKYMDIGHNEYLSDLSFVAHMPELEVLIASESGVKDLTGFDNCKKLTWLELAYCYKLENIDALAGCDGLKYLNLSYSKVTSLAPLDGLALERFVYLKPRASTKEQNTFVAIHPKDQCITVFYGYSMPYSYGWRYNDNGKTMFWYYKDVIREVFNYDAADAIIDAQKKAEGK